jgi:hypothetical protein
MWQMRQCTEMQSVMATQNRTALQQQGSNSAAMVTVEVLTANSRHLYLRKQSWTKKLLQRERRLRLNEVEVAPAKSMRPQGLK